ncbi:hypothetical protein HUT11_35300 (plasmid) [Streptomyces seoulensis]|nr:hypothetical protein HUT11_35300 [Streptomyces seoulensis]
MAGSIRDRLTTAVGTLKEAGDYDSAAAVESVLAPRGYLLLKQTRSSASTLTITITKDLRQALADAGEEFGVVFSALAEEAYRKVRDEEWVPSGPVRGPGGPKAVLNVSVDDELRREVRDMLPRLSQEAGFSVSEGNIVLTHICDEVGIERPNTADEDMLYTRVPKTLLQHFQTEAARQGLELRQILEDGMRALLDGSWLPERHPYFTAEKRGKRKGPMSESDRDNLRVRVDKTLLAELRSRQDELSERAGFLVHPGLVMRALLTERLGTPAV